MHIYIYDDYVSQKKYDQSLIKIETRITDLGLSGKIIRLGILKNIRAAIEDELKRGAKTIVAVGNNKIFNTVINAMFSIGQTNIGNIQVPLALIPVGKKDNGIAQSLGLENETSACDILSARRIENIDLALANNHYFISQASIDAKGTTLEIDQNYSIEIAEPGEIKIINLPLPDFILPEGLNSNPTDNSLELIVFTSITKKLLRIKTGGLKESIINFNNVNIINNSLNLLIDSSLEVQCPVEIKLAEIKLPVVVGKDRIF